jgi:hypothetical protein
VVTLSDATGNAWACLTCYPSPRVHLTTKPLIDAARLEMIVSDEQRSAVAHCELLRLLALLAALARTLVVAFRKQEAGKR